MSLKEWFNLQSVCEKVLPTGFDQLVDKSRLPSEIEPLFAVLDKDPSLYGDIVQALALHARNTHSIDLESCVRKANLSLKTRFEAFEDNL